VRDYPSGAKQRQALRADVAKQGRAKGERDAMTMIRSINCRERWLAYGDQHQPCGNDGSGCCCTCHDQPESGS
jgi:hypothetical protein